jgi:hypothetical protein
MIEVKSTIVWEWECPQCGCISILHEYDFDIDEGSYEFSKACCDNGCMDVKVEKEYL